MQNMFSGSGEKKVPNNFNECYRNDDLTNNLWSWCERLETIGKIIAIILGVFTFFFALFTVRDVTLTLLTLFLGVPIAVFLGYINFHVIALLVGALASIVQHTRISANLSLYKYREENNITTSPQKQEKKSSDSSRNSHVWRCEKCNNLISAYPCVHCSHEKS